MPGLKKPGCPKMFDLLETSYEPKDAGYYDKKPGLRLRATSKQLDCWELAIDLLMQVDLEERRLIWSRAMRFSWVSLARRFGCHRITIKRRYVQALMNMEGNASKVLIDKIDKI
tara:strand:- start:2300 stop:2641 length:342 start_codon:yes stop_codon:yes gene_type:complete